MTDEYMKTEEYKELLVSYIAFEVLIVLWMLLYLTAALPMLFRS